MRARNLLVVMLLSMCAHAVRAQEGDAMVSGEININGTVVGMVLDLRALGTDNASGSMDIPIQGLVGVPLENFEDTERGVRFVAAIPGLPAAARPVFELNAWDDSGEVTGLLAQGGAMFAIEGSIVTADEVDAEARARRPQTPRPPFPYRTEDIVIEGEPVLAGTLTLPDAGEFGEGPYPAVVFFTGSGPQDRDETLFEHKPFAVLADAMARRGVASLRCDDRGVGGTGGVFNESDQFDFQGDGVRMLDFLGTRPEIDAGRMGLLGHSEGGLVAPMVGAVRGDVAFLVLVAPMGLNGLETLVTQGAEMQRRQGMPETYVTESARLRRAMLGAMVANAPVDELKAKGEALLRHDSMGSIPDTAMPQAVRQLGMQMNMAWMRTLLDLEPGDSLRRITAPMLVVMGERDVQVLPELNTPPIEAALKDAGNEDVTVWTLEGLNHLLQNAETGLMEEYNEITETMDPGALEKIVSWIVDRAG